MSTERTDNTTPEQPEVLVSPQAAPTEPRIEPQSEASSSDRQVDPAPTKPTKGRRPPSPSGQAVGGGSTDTVHLAACVYKNPAAKKSMSVHHLQRRLAELGYRDAYTDKDGWYGDLTRRAVAAYQSDNALAGNGTVDAATLESLFADDPNVTLDCG